MNLELLKILEADFKKNFSKTIASRYWHRRTNKIINNLKKKGMEDFRASNSGVGIGFSDHKNTDIRNVLGIREKLFSNFFNFGIFKKIYDQQIKLTKFYCDYGLNFKKSYYENNEIVKDLLNIYKFENTCKWGAVDKINFNNNDIAIIYLLMANRINFINKKINLSKINSFCEIGSGFGANIHFLQTNFLNVKKIICIDIFPTIFILTEYLKSIYGNKVKDYSYFREQEEIKFESNDELEILCVPNWEINKIKCQIDHLHNAHSFVEMSSDQLKLYNNKIFQPYTKSASFVFYQRDIKEKTFNSREILQYFSASFENYELPLIESFKTNDQISIFQK